MARVLERYFGIRTRADIRHDPFLQAASRACIRDQKLPEVNWAFIDLGSLVCKVKAPRCKSCPLRRGCHYAIIQQA
jgi:A/G-specific adenine glycosylase